jgi:hypothetical protein
MVFFADIVRDVARELIMSNAMNDFVSSDRSDMEVFWVLCIVTVVLVVGMNEFVINVIIE